MADIQIDKAQIATSVDANFTIPTNALTQKLIILLHKKIWYYLMNIKMTAIMRLEVVKKLQT